MQRNKSAAGGVAVGTEANAIQNMRRNAKNFTYPAEGFITPIEHSLLYAMIEYPERYPESVVKSEIEDEEFEVYLYVNEETRKGSSGADKNVGGYAGDASARPKGQDKKDGENEDEEDGGDHDNTEEQPSSQPNIHGEERVSYAQLSALLALSAEKNPSKATPDQEGSTASSSANNNSQRGHNDNKSSGNRNKTDEPALSIGQALCRKLLKTVTRYCDAHNLDRQTEISELLNPVERRCQIRNEKAALKQLLPAYAGYTLSLVTGNPLPLLIGAAALTGPDPMVEENSNVSEFRQKGGRVGDMETTGLLDECDSD